ncbi:MAG TPA: OsmC family protein [Rhizomicrobium sp.]|jgi:putative redox protein|nr:OsmC family protein [Rhizomicrobium sp.]
MTHAKGTIGLQHYAMTIDADGHCIISDEPPSNGGKNAGPSPYDLLLSSLCACTAMTLRMYADRKEWDMSRLTVELRFSRDAEKVERIDRTLTIEGDLDDAQRERLADIAERTPVTLTLRRGLAIVTTLAPKQDDLDERLDEALEESFPASDPPNVSKDPEAS